MTSDAPKDTRAGDLVPTLVDMALPDDAKDRGGVRQAELDAILANARRLLTKARADATWRAYASDWRQFEAYCDKYALPALPTTTLALLSFLADQASQGKAPSTIQRRLVAIRTVHVGSGKARPDRDPKVAELMKGIVRDSQRIPNKKKAALPEDIQAMADAVTPQTNAGLRNRALLLFGFASALRRSELVAIERHHLTEDADGLTLVLPTSKTDQEGRGQTIAVIREPDSDYCPVRALNDWLTVAEIEDGPVFLRMHRHDAIGKKAMSAQSVALVIKDHAERVNLDASRYSGHSLRRGFLTSAAKAKKNLLKMAEHSRHKSLETVREYVDAESRFEDHAGEGLLGHRPRESED